ncbi:MAG: hypothetical protein DRP45_01020 [Candidatus Zixiibacteriota bacterium]|nr:MAG: hypothetical protein DRP45_01020 [candidate division Zixibacteria bacterium]
MEKYARGIRRCLLCTAGIKWDKRVKLVINYVRYFIGIVFTVLVICGGATTARTETVVILFSDSLTSTKRTISGARSVIKRSSDSVSFVNVHLKIGNNVLSSQIDSVRMAHPDVILTIGSTATRIAKESFPNIPTVFSSVMYPSISGFVESLDKPGELITGASLDIPVEIQFRYFREIVPDLKKIGVLYTSNTARLIPPSRVVATEMGLELVAVEITSPSDLGKALESFALDVDGLWSVADPNLFDPQSTKYILLNALKYGLPFMGFSRHVVESGALFAIDFDYKAIGRQAGTIVSAVLSGTKPVNIPVTTPDITWFHYNERTATRLEIKIPPQLVAIAKEVYR